MLEEFDITIEGDAKGPFDPERLSVMCVSPRQVYGSGPIFKAIFRQLYDSCAKVLIVLPHTLEEQNFGLELNDDSDSDDEALAPKISQRLKKSWLKVNFDSDPEMRRMRKEMAQEGRLEFLDWEECKQKFKKELAAVEQELTQEGKEKDACDQTAYANAKLFFRKAQQKHGQNPMFQAACLKGDEHVIRKYQKYSRAEICMGKAWKGAGITQVLYPKDYYVRIHSKNPNPDNIDLFQCISSAFDSSIRVCNIKVTPREFVPKPERRKASAEAKVTKELEFISALKKQKRELESKLGLQRAELRKTETQLQKKMDEIAGCVWSHSSDVEVLSNTVIDALQKAKKAEDEARHNLSYAQELAGNLGEMRQEIAFANGTIDELTSSNRTLESQLNHLMADIEHREQELETYKAFVDVIDSRTAAIESRETAMKDEADRLKIEKFNLAQQKAALEQLLEFTQENAASEQLTGKSGNRSVPTKLPSFWTLPGDSTFPSVHSAYAPDALKGTK